MIIGVDAGALSIRDDRLRVGVYRVTLNLLRELGRIDKTNEYRLYTFLPIAPSQMRELGLRMKNVVIRPAIGWSMIQIPIELRRHPVDVFLGLSQMIPLSRARNIGFIYDLGFLRYPDAYPGSLARMEMQTKQLVKHSDHILTISKSTQADVVRAYRVDKEQITGIKCDQCGRLTGVEKHTCPFAEEVNDDNTECNCFPDCEEYCRDNI